MDTTILWALVGALFLGVLLALVFLVAPNADRRRRPPQEVASQSASAVTRTALAAGTAIVRTRGMESRIALGLEQADMRLRPNEWVVLRFTVEDAVALAAD